MSGSPATAPDRKHIVETLEHVQRRRWIGRLTRDLLTGFTVSLVIPLGLTVWYRLSPVSGTAAAIVLGGWIVGLAVYAAWTWRERGTLASAAASVDRKADLRDELTTAYWFHREGLTSAWIELQRRRAAQTAGTLDVDRLYPFTIPRRSRVTGALVVLVLLLNLIPLSWTRGWLQARPVVIELSEQEQRLLAEIQRMLEEAEFVQGTELPPETAELLQELRDGEPSAEDALADLQNLEALEELTFLDAETLEALLEGLPEALEGEELEVSALDIREISAEELRELEARLEELSRQEQEALEQMASDLAQAAEELANDLEQLARADQSGQPQEDAGRQLDELEEALRQQDNAAGAEQQAAGEEMPADMKPASPEEGGVPEAQRMAAATGADTGTPTAEQGRGELSAPGAGDEIQYGDPTRLEVELRPEILDLEPNPVDEPENLLIDQPSQAAESKLQYEPIEAEVTYAEPDLLDADRIPWTYRDLVKCYFRAVGPRGKHDH